MRDFLGFQFMVILNLYGIPFHAVVVFRPEHNFLFKSASSYCGNGDRRENGSTVEIKVPIFDSYKPKIRTISAASLAGKSPKIPALFQICFEIGRLLWVLVVCARAIYTHARLSLPQACFYT